GDVPAPRGIVLVRGRYAAENAVVAVATGIGGRLAGVLVEQPFADQGVFADGLRDVRGVRFWGWCLAGYEGGEHHGAAWGSSILKHRSRADCNCGTAAEPAESVLSRARFSRTVASHDVAQCQRREREAR